MQSKHKCSRNHQNRRADTRRSPIQRALFRLRVRPADDSDGDAAPGVARRLPERVGLLVDDDRSTDDRIAAAELNQLVVLIDHSHSFRIGLDVAQVADVTRTGVGGSVLHLVRVEVTARRFPLFTVGQIAELMDVEAVLSWRQTAELAADVHVISHHLKQDRPRDAAFGDRFKHADRSHAFGLRVRHAAGTKNNDCGRQQQRGTGFHATSFRLRL